MEGFDWRCPLNVCTLIHMPMPRNSKHFSRQNYTFEVLFWPQKQWKYEEWVAKNTRYRNRSAKCLEICFFAPWPRIALLLATWPSDLTLSFLQIAFGLHADWAMENIQWKLLCNCKSHLELRNKEWTLILRGWWWSWYEEGRQIMTGRSVGEQAIFTPETSRRVDGSFKQVS